MEADYKADELHAAAAGQLAIQVEILIDNYLGRKTGPEKCLRLTLTSCQLPLNRAKVDQKNKTRLKKISLLVISSNIWVNLPMAYIGRPTLSLS